LTIMQNALHSFGGDWSWVPPKANTVGPRLGVRPWLDPADGPDRLHHPRRRRRRRRDSHVLTEANSRSALHAFGMRTWTRAGAILLVPQFNLALETP
jgi:hypothetical protein